MTHKLEIQPRDILFFRDGRPLGASDSGQGADWPLPSTLHEALLSSFHDLWPSRQPWEFEHRNCRDERENKDWDQNWRTSSMRFGGLQTAGPFPSRNGTLYLPVTADIEPGADGSPRLMSPCDADTQTMNLPSPLKMTVAPQSSPTKKTLGEWMSADQFRTWLRGGTPEETLSSNSFFHSENRPGIALDPATGATEESQFYSAEYLRLRDDVTLAAFASCPTVNHDPERGREVRDAVAEYLDQGRRSFIFGGQRGVVRFVGKRQTDNLTELFNPDNIVSGINCNVKWVLISPAVYSKGWLPGFIDPISGSVELRPPGESLRRAGEKRADWRRRIRRLPSINANLIAARVPKPRVFSGWVQPTEKNSSAGKGKNAGPKRTFRAVPAGAVYYFQASNPEEAKKLVYALNGARRSDFFGEKGFGIGLCGIWQEKN